MSKTKKVVSISHSNDLFVHQAALLSREYDICVNKDGFVHTTNEKFYKIVTDRCKDMLIPTGSVDDGINNIKYIWFSGITLKNLCAILAIDGFDVKVTYLQKTKNVVTNPLD